jgi:hypothetical protein
MLSTIAFHPIYQRSKKAPTLSRPPWENGNNLLQKRKQIRVHDIQRTVSFALLNHTRNINLTGALRDHLNVNPLLPQRAEEPPANTDHAAQLAADQRNNSHIRNEIDVAPDAEVVHGAFERGVFDAEFFLAVPGQQGDFRVQGHRDVDFGGGDEVDAQAVFVQDAEDGHQEAVGAGALLAVHVKHGDAALDGHGGGALGRVVLA